MQTLKNPKLKKRVFIKIMSFWGISQAFCLTGHQKLAEFTAHKRTNSRTSKNCLTKCIKEIVARLQKKWICIGYNNVWYYNSIKDVPSQMRDNIALDQSTTIEILSLDDTVMELTVGTSRRQITLRVQDGTTGLFVLYTLLKSFTLSHYVSPHKFGSFAPTRRFNDCEFFIRGEMYFREVHRLLSKAEHEIMISGWFISPEFPLIRPMVDTLDNEPSRLCSVLQDAAEKRNVKVYILVYGEFEHTVYTNSEHAKSKLENLSKNIKVIRHPKNFLFYWSHHEKMVLVDRKVAMIGGLDIAWGRWDDDELKLFDTDLGHKTFPGVDYYNPFIKDIVKGRKYNTRLIEDDCPRMPWQDYAVRLVGPIVYDYLNHFVNYWNHARDQMREHEVLVTQFILPGKEEEQCKNRRATINRLPEDQVAIAGIIAISHEPDMSPANLHHQSTLMTNSVLEDIRASKLDEIINKVDTYIKSNTEDVQDVVLMKIKNYLVKKLNYEVFKKEDWFVELFKSYAVAIEHVLPHKYPFICPDSDSKVFFLDIAINQEDKDDLEQYFNQSGSQRDILNRSQVNLSSVSFHHRESVEGSFSPNSVDYTLP